MRVQDSIRGRSVRNCWLVFAALASLCVERGRGAEEGPPPERVIEAPAGLAAANAPQLYIRPWQADGQAGLAGKEGGWTSEGLLDSRRTIAAGMEAKIELSNGADAGRILAALEDGAIQEMRLKLDSEEDARHLGRFKSLRSLHIEFEFARPGPPVEGDKVVESISPLRRLRALGVSSAPISDKAAAIIGELALLESLSVHANRMSDLGVAHLKKLRHLKSLGLSGHSSPLFDGENLAPMTGAAFVHLKAMPNLQELSIRLKEFTDEGLAEAAGFKPLRTITLQGVGVSDKGLIPFLRATPWLRWMTLSDTSATEASLERLADMDRLEGLGISFKMKIGWRGAAALAKARSLWFLSLVDVQFPAEELPALMTLPRLRTLQIGDIQGITQADADALQKSKPRLQLIFWPYSGRIIPSQTDPKPVS